MPGGAIGVAEKLNGPKIASCADDEEFLLEERMMFKVREHCGIILSHSFMRKLGSTVQSPAIR